VTKELAGTLTDMQSDNSSSIVNPNNLLSALSQKAPHLAGTGDQEDAHELLRTLMETVRAEELRVKLPLSAPVKAFKTNYSISEVPSQNLISHWIIEKDRPVCGGRR